jgi:integrase-like protein
MLRPKRKRNGRYAVRWREGGGQRQQTFDRREVAERFATRLNDRLQSHGLVDLDQGTTTLSEFVVSYWRDYAIPNLATNTQDTYIQVYAKHLEPRVGHRQLRELTPKRLAALRAELGRASVGDPTVLKALTMLSSVLSHAVTEEELERNPLREIRKPAQGSGRDVIPPPPEQVEHARHLFLEAGDRRSATIVSLLAYAGLRTYSEIRLLEWRHVGDRALSIYASKTSRADVIRMLAPLATDLAEAGGGTGGAAPGGPSPSRRGSAICRARTTSGTRSRRC